MQYVLLQLMGAANLPHVSSFEGAVCQVWIVGKLFPELSGVLLEGLGGVFEGIARFQDYDGGNALAPGSCRFREEHPAQHEVCSPPCSQKAFLGTSLSPEYKEQMPHAMFQALVVSGKLVALVAQAGEYTAT